MEPGMPQAESSYSPAERLTGLILDSLVSESLLSDELAAQIGARVAAGKMQPLDWKLIFEKSLGLR